VYYPRTARFFSLLSEAAPVFPAERAMKKGDSYMGSVEHGLNQSMSEMVPTVGELDRIHTSVADAWRIYMTWFTFFFTANLVVMSWVLTRTSEIAQSGSVWLLCLFWIVFNTTGAVSSIGLAKYSHASSNRMKTILEILKQRGKVFDAELPFPQALSVMGACFNAAALIGNICVWAYIWSKFG
jgi:hypothetical protein